MGLTAPLSGRVGSHLRLRGVTCVKRRGLSSLRGGTLGTEALTKKPCREEPDSPTT